jgi:hypothetical protein
VIVFLRGRAVARFPGFSSHNFVFLEIMQEKKISISVSVSSCPFENPPSSSLSHRENKSRALHRPLFLNSVHYGLIDDHFLLQQQHQKKKKKKNRRRRKRFQCFSCSFELSKHQQSCFVH